MQVIYNYIIQNYFELIAAILGLIAIRLQIFQNIWYWLVSIIMVIMYIYIYHREKLYADMSLQVFYLGISIYGWYNWLFGSREKNSLPVSRLGISGLVVAILVAIALFFMIAYILINFSDSDIPWWDSFTTSLSFVAAWMLAKKQIENWIIWIIVDAVSIGIYIYKELYPTTVLFAVLTILAFVGYREWNKELKNNG